LHELSGGLQHELQTLSSQIAYLKLAAAVAAGCHNQLMNDESNCLPANIPLAQFYRIISQLLL
jgi:hypothetical protein